MVGEYNIPEEVKDLEQDKVVPQLTENPSSASTWEDNLSNHIKSILSDSNDLSLFSREIEKLLLREALIASKGKRIEAAKILGLGRNTITRKIKDLGL